MNLSRAELRQLLGGMELRYDPARCSDCGHKLHEGARIGVAARRIDGANEWEIAATYCINHTPHSPLETPHGVSVLAVAEVGALVDTARQSHAACLLNVEVEDIAAPDADDTNCNPIIEADGNSTVVR